MSWLSAANRFAAGQIYVYPARNFARGLTRQSLRIAKRMLLAASSLHVAMQTGLYLHLGKLDVWRVVSEDSDPKISLSC